MSNDFQIGGSSTKPQVVGHCYYRAGDDPADPTDGDSLLLCLDCDGANVAPMGMRQANVHDKPCYGRAVPHLECDKCGDKFTKTGGP